MIYDYIIYMIYTPIRSKHDDSLEPLAICKFIDDQISIFCIFFFFQ